MAFSTDGCNGTVATLWHTQRRRMGQRVRSYSARRQHSIGPYHTLTHDGHASSPAGRGRGPYRRKTRQRWCGTHEPAIQTGELGFVIPQGVTACRYRYAILCNRLCRLSRTSQRRTALCSAWWRAARAGCSSALGTSAAHALDSLEVHFVCRCSHPGSGATLYHKPEGHVDGTACLYLPTLLQQTAAVSTCQDRPGSRDP